MGSAFDNVSFMNDEDTIRFPNRAQTVSDDKAGAASHEMLHGFLDVHFGAGIDTACSFIKDQDRRISQYGAGNGEQLPLPLAKIAASFGEFGVVALWHAVNKLLGIGKPGRLFNSPIRGIEPAVADISPNSIGEKHGILKYDPKLSSETAFLYSTDILTVNTDRTAVDIVKTGEKVYDCRFACAGWTDKSDGLSGFCPE